MPLLVEITVEGGEKLRELLNQINPSRNPEIFSRALTLMAVRTQGIAASESIIGGGRFRGPAGPRGGKGKFINSPPHPTKLTSRTGRGRGSIRTDLSGLPMVAEVGSDVGYMAVHETGGAFNIPGHRRTGHSVKSHGISGHRRAGYSVPSYTVKAHQRSSAFGRSTNTYSVKAHTVRGHLVNPSYVKGHRIRAHLVGPSFVIGHIARFPRRAWLEPALNKAVLDAPNYLIGEVSRAAG